VIVEILTKFACIRHGDVREPLGRDVNEARLERCVVRPTEKDAVLRIEPILGVLRPRYDMRRHQQILVPSVAECTAASVDLHQPLSKAILVRPTPVDYGVGVRNLEGRIGRAVSQRSLLTQARPGFLWKWSTYRTPIESECTLLSIA
jgi:hypothetical protein